MLQEDRLPATAYTGAISSQMRSSLDVIEDAQMAIDSYFKGSVPQGSGECYVKVYGILQVLFVQQDAAHHLLEALGIKFPETPVLAKIRRIRSDAVGHPTKRGRGTKLSFHFISRVTLTQEGFQLISEREGADDAFEDVDIPQLIAEQNREITKLLAQLVAQL
jgi:hypothetical protein